MRSLEFPCRRYYKQQLYRALLSVCAVGVAYAGYRYQLLKRRKLVAIIHVSYYILVYPGIIYL